MHRAPVRRSRYWPCKGRKGGRWGSRNERASCNRLNELTCVIRVSGRCERYCTENRGSSRAGFRESPADIGECPFAGRILVSRTSKRNSGRRTVIESTSHDELSPLFARPRWSPCWSPCNGVQPNAPLARHAFLSASAKVPRRARSTTGAKTYVAVPVSNRCILVTLAWRACAAAIPRRSAAPRTGAALTERLAKASEQKMLRARQAEAPAGARLTLQNRSAS